MSYFKNLFKKSHEDFMDALDQRIGLEKEWEYLDHFCLVKPLKNEEDEFLKRFSTLSAEDKNNAVIESKKWGNFYLTNKMQQSL